MSVLHGGSRHLLPNAVGGKLPPVSSGSSSWVDASDGGFCC